MRRLTRLVPLVLLAIGAGLIIWQLEGVIVGEPIDYTDVAIGAAVILAGSWLKTYTHPKAPK